MKDWMRYEEIASGQAVSVNELSYERDYRYIKREIEIFGQPQQGKPISLPYKFGVDKLHLIELIAEAVDNRLELFLPNNLYTITPIQGYRNSHHSDVPPELVKQVRRFAGWIRALPAWCEGTGLGAGSPYEPDWWKIFKKHSAPGSLTGFIQKAWAVAERLLRPMGLRPIGAKKMHKWEPQMRYRILAASSNPRRAGFIWAATTIESLAPRSCRRGFRGYREAREVLEHFAANKVGTLQQRAIVASSRLGHQEWHEDNSDGVRSIVTPFYKKHKIIVYRYIANDEEGLGYMTTFGNRTYHDDNLFWNFGDPKKYLWLFKRATTAWKAQDVALAKQAKREEELLEAINHQGDCELVVLYSDSRKAGNCHDGTMAWVRKTFGRERYAVPLGLLKAHISDQMVQRVVNSI